jgi:hypothetical protein
MRLAIKYKFVASALNPVSIFSLHHHLKKQSISYNKLYYTLFAST